MKNQIPYAPGANQAARWEPIGTGRVIFGTIQLSPAVDFGGEAAKKRNLTIAGMIKREKENGQ